ncbi:18378_t:CDS:2 [Gigaspora margarita]|uniref:18378_t:CDS:1 n=1 Tax=Gigaspora margarita TaxID=4874 RepID=A0ABN7VJ62_GIGMA|nr:18378_t:CDS:2 [Gigaspora margarita]
MLTQIDIIDIQRQMNNKCPISEVYLKEETVDNNESQESECESMVSEFSDIDESVEENSIVFGLKVGDELDDWDAAKKQVQNYAMEVGFELVKRRLEKNKHGEIIRRTFECKHLDISSKHHHLNPEMLNQVKFLVNIGCEAGMIICGLQKNFPNTIIYSKNVYNAIHFFKHNEQLVKTDASETYRRLMQLQREKTASQKYLECALRTNVTSWALCYTHKSFNARIQSTQHVESYNALIKRSIKKLYNQNPSISLPNIIGRYFKRIDNMIKKYLTSLMLKAQRHQMNESLLYRAKEIKD